MPSKKRKQAEASLSNLKKGRCGPSLKRRLRSARKQLELELSEATAEPAEANAEPRFKDAGTNTRCYSRNNPKAGSRTKLDELRDKITEVQSVLVVARPLVPRTTNEKIMLLQYLFSVLQDYNDWFLSDAVKKAELIFQWTRGDIFKITADFLEDPKSALAQKVQAKRGRGSAEFIRKYGDKFCVLKNEHAKSILEYVRVANDQRGGMVTAGRIQAHLLDKYGIVFKRDTIYYCLKHRLKLQYAYAGKPRLVFTFARRRTAIIFCTKYDEAIKLQQAGTHIIVWMDESYCHCNHFFKRTWNENGVIPVRPRGNGALMIIVHAMTIHGFLLPPGERLKVKEWTTGAHATAEMIFRSKYAKKHRIKDYHDTMDGEFFMYWVRKRLATAFRRKYPDKKMILVLDNAPYHHSIAGEGFRPAGMSKTEIVDRLKHLPRKRGVRKLREIKVKPYADNPAPPPLPSTQIPTTWNGAFFLDNGGEIWSIDGVDDQGFGDAVVYSRVGVAKAGAVESTLLPNFTARLNHPEHKERWYLLGSGDPALRFVRSSGILNAANKVPWRDRANELAIRRLRQQCRQYVANEKTVTYTYKLADLDKRYNGRGFRGSGGPPTEWLRAAIDKFIKKNYPELQRTMLMQFFEDAGWKLVFTVPYWASSQPIEQVWAYVKQFVALRWFPGRTMAQLRHQIICAMYGALRAPESTRSWTEPRRLQPHSGLTHELAMKFILHSEKAINDFILNNRYIKHMGRVGTWSRADIERLVLPTACTMEEDDLEDQIGDLEQVNEVEE